MTAEEVSQLIQLELSTFSYTPPAGDRVIGVPWDEERMAREVAALRNALVNPKLRPVDVVDHPRARTMRMLWVVTEPDANGYVVVFDQEERRFGLALTSGSGRPETVAVWGDLSVLLLPARRCQFGRI